MSMCSTVGEEAATASLYRCPIDNDRFVLPNSLFLNNVPHRPSARQFFYNKVCLGAYHVEAFDFCRPHDRPRTHSLSQATPQTPTTNKQIVRAVDAAILDPNFPRRMQLKFLIPESNPAFDSYRIGTVLEMVGGLGALHSCVTVG